MPILVFLKNGVPNAKLANLRELSRLAKDASTRDALNKLAVEEALLHEKIQKRFSEMMPQVDLVTEEIACKGFECCGFQLLGDEHDELRNTDSYPDLRGAALRFYEELSGRGFNPEITTALFDEPPEYGPRARRECYIFFSWEETWRFGPREDIDMKEVPIIVRWIDRDGVQQMRVEYPESNEEE